MKRERREVLLHIHPGDGSEYTFYVDGTYRCPMWKEHQYAEWKLEDRNIVIRHRDITVRGVEQIGRAHV